MSGTEEGGRRAAQTNKERHGAEFYRKIGSAGGKVKGGRPKGFAYSAAHGLDWHKTAGKKGGSVSRIKPRLGVTKPGLIRRILNG